MLWLAMGVGGLQLAFSEPSAQGQAKDITYAEHIGPIIHAKCYPCHRPGGMGPFGLSSYDEVKKRYVLVRQVAMTKQMPPTDAASDVGKLVTEQQLTDEETVLVQEWVRQGMKEGPPIAPPKPARFSWRLGEPNTVVKALDSHSVRAEGNPYRETHVLPIAILEDTFITAFDVLPATPAAVRYVRLGYRQSSSKHVIFAPEGADPTALIGSWAPGHFGWQVPVGSGIRVPQSSELVAEVLYDPQGRNVSGQIDFALYLSKEPRTRPASIKTMGHKNFGLAPDAWTSVTDNWTLDKEIELVALYPEVKLFARQIQLMAHVPGQPPKLVFRVFSYDPFWLGSYVFEKPVRLPEKTRLSLEVQYNNTKHSFGDQDRETPPVKFGPKDTDETFWLHLQYVPVLAP